MLEVHEEEFTYMSSLSVFKMEVIRMAIDPIKLTQNIKESYIRY